MGELISKEQILAADDLPRERITVKAWGGDVMIRTMTGEERDAFEESLIDRSGDGPRRNMLNFRAKLLSRCIVNDKGNRLFEEGEIEALGRKNGGILDMLSAVAQRLNRLSDDDIARLIKN